jgi:hypothetical protein
MTTPSAYAFELALCSDPKCTAIHIISFDKNSEIILNTAIKEDHLPVVIKMMQDHLYALAVMKDK